MLHRPSLQLEYSLVFSGDPALDLPALELAEGADWTDEQRERHREARDRDRARLRVARETGRWSEILKPDQQPTLFKIRPVEGPLLTWIRGYSLRARLSDDEGIELVLRCALREVENLGAFKIVHEVIEGRTVVAEATMAELYAIGRDIDPLFGRRIVLELGMLVLTRAAEGLPPKS